MKVRSMVCGLVLFGSAVGCGSVGATVRSQDTATSTDISVPSSVVPRSQPLGVAVTVVGTDQIVGFDAAGRAIFAGPAGHISGDGKRLVRFSIVNGNTKVEWLSAIDGTSIATRSVAGELVVAAVSFDGVSVALSDRDYSPLVSGEMAVGRRETNIAVVRSDTELPTQTKLMGNFSPEAFAGADLELALLEYVPAEHPTSYRVRLMTVDPIANLQPPFGWNTKNLLDDTEVMAGHRGDHVLTEGGQYLYTLYRSSNGTAFVHALNLSYGAQSCIDLPSDVIVSSGTIGATPDGSQLFVLTSQGKLLTIDTHTNDGSPLLPAVGRVTDLSSTALTGRLSLAVTATTVYAASAEGLATFTIGTGHIETTPTVQAPTTIVLDSSGSALFVANDSEVWQAADPTHRLELPSGIGAIVNIRVN